MKRGNDSEDDYVSDDDYAADNQFEAMPAPVAKKRAPKKAKKVKDPDAPKRPQSAFFLYMNSQRAQFKLDNPELSHKQITSKISETWNSFGPDDKAAYEEKAGEAKAAYAIAKAAYDEKTGKSLAKTAPKRALSSFMLYLNDNRARIKEENEGIKFGEISKVASVEWKALDADAKAPFEARNKELKSAYEINMAEFKSLNPDYGKKAPKAKKAKAAPVPQQQIYQDFGGEVGSAYGAYSDEESD